MGIGDWGLGIGDWGLGIGPQSPIPNPQSPKIRKIFNSFIYQINNFFNTLMENISSDKIIENEINSFIDIALHLDSYLLKGKIGLVNLNNKIKKYKLSQNSIDLLNQMISSEKVSNYFCYNNNIKEIRNKLGIMKAIKEVFKQESEKEEEEKVIRKINPYSFNQFSLANKQSFFSSEAEFYFLKNFIHSKILNIIKSSLKMIYLIIVAIS